MGQRKRKIAVVTGSRAEYGLLFWLMKEIEKDPAFVLQIIVTGSHLSREFGSTYKVIEKDGFRVNERIPILGHEDSVTATAKAMGSAVGKFAQAFERLKPDFLILLGDRYEIFAAAQAAFLARIPIAHIAGGDSTEGAFDEAFRHSITKMSHLHFVTNDLSAKRVRQLGENPQHIYVTGNPGLDQIKRLKLLSKEEVQKSLRFTFRKKNLLITFHPSTLEKESPAKQFGELLNALDALGKEAGLIFTKPNADPGGRSLIRMIDQFVAKRPHAAAYTSLGQLLYLSIMRSVDAVIGNSSSGIYEAPSFQVPTVNIGNRQKGRVLAASVINCPAEAKLIRKAIQEAFALNCSKAVNPYGDGETSVRILSHLKDIQDWSALIPKHFFEYEMGSEKMHYSSPCFMKGEARWGKDLLTPPFPSPLKKQGEGNTKKVYVIAEAGVNHNGSIALAKKLVDEAALAGADAVKFQIFKVEDTVCRDTEKADYQKQTAGVRESQWEMLQKLELQREDFCELAEYAKERRIDFLATPFDEEGVDLLAEKIGVKYLKVASGEITNAPLLLKMARTGLPLIVSTGMAALSEIQDALGVIAFGYLDTANQKPSHAAFRKAFELPEAGQILRGKVILLQATTDYPTPLRDVNLYAMDTLRDQFGLRTGLSDHSAGISASVAAVARGAVVIEKHLTLDKNMDGPDHKASLDPKEFGELVRWIRELEQTLGSPEKSPTISEAKNIPVVRRSLVAKRPIKKGEKFTQDNLTAKRPGTGIPPAKFWETVGKTAKKDFKKDEMVIV